ncbi:MAG: hypothetical protein DCC49_13715 [Acidobacteria bacterium]|nr:MAG: hypothetical protein DCC49_13715 [Acidobacteriota bacterium]
MQAIIDAACHFGSAGDGRGIGRGTNGTYFIIDTRTGQIIARDLGRSDVTRFLSSRDTVDWGSVGWSAAEGIPWVGTAISSVRCHNARNSGGCGVSVAGSFASSTYTSAASYVATTTGRAVAGSNVVTAIASIVIPAGMDLGGQLAGGASLW